MKVAFIVRSFPVVSETFIEQQIRFFQERGDEVSVLTLNADPDHSSDADGLANCVQLFGVNSAESISYKRFFNFSFHYLFNLFTNRYTKGTFNFIRHGIFWLPENIQKLVKDRWHLGDYDLVVSHFGEVGVFASQLLAAGLLSGKLATIFHGYDISKKSHLKKWSGFYLESFEHTDHIFPVSELWRTKLLALGAPPDKVVTCHMGIDIDDFVFRPVDIPASETEQPMRILLVGRCVEKKGIIYAIKAASLCETPIRLDIVGAGPMYKALVSEIASLGLGSIVDMHGALPHDKVKILLAKAHVFLLPSIDAEDGDMEGIPVSLMEAMASGVPVISTYHSGIPELITDKYSGLLCQQKSAPELAAAIDSLRRRAVDNDLMVDNARQVIESDFNDRVNNSKFIEVFETKPA